jgi:hypothetical protein
VDRQKYAGKVAPYTSTEKGRSVEPIWMPRNKDAMVMANVKNIFPIPSTAWFEV